MTNATQSNENSGSINITKNIPDMPVVLEEPSRQVLDELFASQLATSLRLRQTSARDRISKLKLLRDEMVKHRDAFYNAFRVDYNKPASEVELTEFLPVFDEIQHAIKNLRSWMRPRRVGTTLTSFGTSSQVAFQPLGRCLILSAWNYPVLLLLGPLVSAIAAGNTVILKPSEFTATINSVIVTLISSVFSRDEVTVVLGGISTAQQLLTLPFNHIFFTGSPAVGKQVMAAASLHLASVTLELGGKSPTIVDETANLERAAASLIWGKLINCGQSCVAPDYVFVQKNVRQVFVQHCIRALHQRFGVTAIEQKASSDLARIINKRHTNRIANLITDATDLGATVTAGGQVDIEARYIAPTILENLHPQSKILEEEIFGPVLPILEYDEINEVIDHINRQPKPLALYIWSKQRATIDHILQETSSGGACINQCMVHYAHTGLPMGGVNNSGIGNSHGHYGFKAFSHERAVLTGGKIFLSSMMYPPYTPARVRLIRILADLIRRF